MTLWRRLVTQYVFPHVQNKDMKNNFIIESSWIIDLISLYKVPKTHGKHWIIFNYSLGGSDSKDSACNSGDPGLSPGSGRSRRREWLPTPLFLPGKSHDQRSLVGYSLWGCNELDMTEWLTLSFTFFHYYYSHWLPLCLELISSNDIEILPTSSFFSVTNIRNFWELTSFSPGCI